MEVTALLMGLAGSLHCIGMCSPLALAVSNLTAHAVLNKFIYNGGRILTYSLMGSVVASWGYILPIEKYQSAISLIMGISLLVLALAGVKNYHLPFITPVLSKATNLLKQHFSKALKQKTFLSIFLLGSINGFLPCGLTMIALSFCLGLQGPIDGFQFMFLFGMGTLPVMLGFTSLANTILTRFHISFRSLTSATMVFAGSLLIARAFLFHEHVGDHTTMIEIMMCTGK
jgi:uncharacterized protein